MIATPKRSRPVQQNTGEVFEIVRKRLFDSLPPADRIDEVAQAYVVDATEGEARRHNTDHAGNIH